ncbi:assimilatory nitrate reductase electron transfer subunit [Streptoalloteichus tenebrarius]|uniref:Assimilatory nitrate reductase electron transfer subunit n=1 Tax=Streptoalloteichus tenebrarius (strain ATCC 17920 / DSM 40477 / JCM 4838 / CBS 697.72 / NBRC 16177 / NCIMB 11028 / NRRL B-12390 / A12253. 1 / ISP 5477) TaxID=1933 RepID=A0ABT1HVR6_STRSD|nr:FAD-dependent oxidoreductase [Streptoalloteichus tenebrarius]MCP2259614.1 assimilatory nitrate reductase electron transfer subunit [Streptoalloteichus tenebrarius]BFF00979.1 FAD-dependent oxidoreductase [Streptoalloteichus tenebrarius]
MSASQVVVVGYGMAGARLAEEVRRRDPEGARVALTVIGAEDHPAYNRVLLSSVLAGSLSPEAVRLHDDGWADRQRVDLRTGTAVRRIDVGSRKLELADGAVLGYDVLVLATGSRAWVPPTDGLLDGTGTPADGVAVFRTLDDCRRILTRARAGAPVAVLGGGLLGLEAARGLAGRGHPVTVIHPVGHLMERQLDAGCGRVLARTLARLGIAVRLNVTAQRYAPGRGLVLSDGGELPAELVVVSAGVRAETGLATAAGLAVDRGVLVDDELRTSDPQVRAIGDCAQHAGTVGGLVQPAWDQAAVLADLLTGADPAARYRGTPVVTRLKARDVDLAALGEVHVDVDEPDAEVLCLQDPARGRYAKLVLRDERVAGAIVLGAPDAAATITQLYDAGTPAPSDRLALLLGRALPSGAPTSPADLPASAVVCRCNTVSKGQLMTAWRAGARGASGLAAATRASTGCGGCAESLQGIADWLARVDPDEEPAVPRPAVS